MLYLILYLMGHSGMINTENAFLFDQFYGVTLEI